MSSKSVTEVTSYIQDLFERDDALRNVWVSGEVSNMTRANSGHWYFTIKDNNAQLRCVMWRSHAAKQSITPKEGDAVEVHGNVTVYASRGEYQLYADKVRPVGVGDLYQQFERLKAELAAQGLFDPERKRPIPTFPRQIGVVTSPTAAAFQDIQNVLRRRFPLAEVILSPTLVQGAEAPPQIVNAIGRLNAYTDVDVILLIRGGGSIEDLWAFNDEQVAHAVAMSRIPVITGVGHEIDSTIVDFVSDDRAPTPSAAAEHATPDTVELHQDIAGATMRLNMAMQATLEDLQDALNNQQRNLRYLSPEGDIRTYRQRIDDLNNRAAQTLRSNLNLLRERLNGRANALNAANPDALLERGYAMITRSEDGERITSTSDASPGTGITIQLKDGELKARVEDKDSHEQYKRTLF